MFWIETFTFIAILAVVSIMMLIDTYWEDGEE